MLRLNLNDISNFRNEIRRKLFKDSGTKKAHKT